MSKTDFGAKAKKFFKEKGFYLVACTCLVAVGMAAWTATAPIGTKNNESQPQNVTSETVTNTQPVSDRPVDVTVSGEPKTSSVTSKTTSKTPVVSKTQKPTAEYFVMPVTGQIIKNYSDNMLQYSETFKDMRLHRGIDIACDKGTAVFASGDGTVTYVGSDPMLGELVKIDHGNGVLCVYCGLNKNIPVGVGDTVNSKTQVGIVGTVPGESAEETHLHFEVYKDGIAASPLKLLKME